MALNISTRVRYGTRAMVELAGEHAEGAVSVKEVAARQRLSVKYLESIMAPLKAAGLVTAVRGVHGGYELTRPPAEIALLDVYKAIDGAPAVVHCVADPEVCSMVPECPTRPVWRRMNEAVKSILEETTLEDLVLRSAAAGSAAADHYDI